MTLLFRYILREYLRVFLLALATFLVLFQVIDFVERYSFYFRHDPAIGDVLQLVALKTFPALGLVIPVATLLASVITLAIFNMSSELIAMRAAGIGFGRIGHPLFWCGTVASLLVIGLNEGILPRINERIHYLEAVKIGKAEELAFFKRDQVWFKDENRIYHIDLFLPTDRLLRGITLYELDAASRPAKRLAAREGRLTDNGWEFDEVQAALFGDAPRMVSDAVLPFEYGIESLEVLEKRPDEMNYNELRRFIRKMRREGVPTKVYETEMHGRLAFGLISILLAVVGVPFAVRPARRGGAMAAITLAIAVGFSYWLVFSFFMTLGRNGLLPPLAAAWAPNVFFLGIAIFFYRRIG